MVFTSLLLSQATVNCQNIQNMPDVTFTLKGKAFTVPASAYVSQVSSLPTEAEKFLMQ